MPGMIKFFRRKRGSTGSVLQSAKDAYWNLVSTLLRTKASVQFNKIVDESVSAKTVSVMGDARTDYFSPFSNIGFSYNLPNASAPTINFNASASTAFNFGTGSFTIECWFMPTASQASSESTFFIASNTSATSYFGLNYDFANQRFVAYLNNTGFSAYIAATTVLNTWYHAALVRSGTTLTIYLNGVSIWTQSGSSAALGYTNPALCRIGGGSAAPFRISNLRVTNTSVYTSNFIPSTEKLSPVVGTQLLTAQSSRFTDVGPNTFITTITGSPTVDAISPFAPATYNAAQHGGSLYLDGTGDYVHSALSDDLKVGVGNTPFTIECWAYPRHDASVDRTICGSGGATGFTWGSTASMATIFYTSASTKNWAWSWFTGSQGVSIRGGTFTPYTWTHLRVTYDGTTTRLFVNGVMVDSSTAGYAIPPNSTDKFLVGAPSYTLTYGETWLGSLSGFNLLKGTCLNTTNFTVPTEPTVKDANTKLFITGTPQSTLGKNNVVVDNSSYKHRVTTYGDVTQSSFGPFAGVGSAYFDGSGDSLTIQDSEDLKFGTQDFTVECWVNFTTVPTDKVILSKGGASVVGPWALMTNGSNQIAFSASSNNSSWDIANYIGATTVITNTWYHIAVTRVGSTFTFWIDGVSKGTATSTASIYSGTQPLSVGGYSNGANVIAGYISNLNIIKGTAKYTSNFSVPTALATAHANTKLLLNFDNDSMVDASNKMTYQLFGNAVVSSAKTKSATSNLYLDGTNSYVALPYTSDMNLGTGDFTIECWIYRKAVTDQTYSDAIMCSKTVAGFAFGVSLDGKVGACATSTTGSWNIRVGVDPASPRGTTVIPLNTWTHLAFCRSGTVWTGYVNGIVDQTWTSASALSNMSSGMYLGKWHEGAGTRHWNGHIEEFKITKGVAKYNGDFAIDVQTLIDPHSKQAVALTTNGVDNATGNTIVDSSGNNVAITRSGNVAQGTFSPFSNSGFSTKFNGSSDNNVTTSAQVIPTGSFTLEAWVYLTSTSETQTIFGQGSGTGDVGRVYLGTETDSGRKWSVQIGQVGARSSFVAELNKWHYVAMTFDGSTIRGYLNGELFASAAQTVGASNWQLKLGGNWGTYWLGGYISNARVSNIVRGTVTSVPTTPFVADANTVFLGCQDNRFKDNSSNNYAMSATSAPSIQAFSPFAPAAYNAVTHGGSAYFDSVGDYLLGDSDGTANSPYSFGTGDFTIETWVYRTASGYNIFLSSENTSGTNAYNCTINNDKFHFSSPVGITGTTTVALNTWYHFALCRSAGVTRLFVNGVQEGPSTSDSTNYICQPNRPCIGMYGYSLGSNYYPFQGHLSNLNIIKGTAKYTSNFTVPASPVLPDANTKLLLNFTNAAVYDNTGKANVEMLGTAKVNMSTVKHASSMAFDGTEGCYAQLKGSQSQLAFGTGDFTIELLVRANSLPASVSTLVDFRGPNGAYPDLLITSSSKLGLYINTGYALVCNTTLTTGVWYHVAWSRLSGVSRLFLNGLLDGTYIDTNNYLVGADRPFIGANGNFVGHERLNGYIEDLRITKGVAKYVTGFTPPNASLGSVVRSLPSAITSASASELQATGGDPYYNQVTLHMHMEGLNGGTTFAEQKGKAFSYTNATLSTSIKKVGNSSAFFNANSSLTFTDTSLMSATDSTVEDATVECWIYPLSYSNEEVYFQRCIWSKGEVYAGQFLKQDGSICYYTGPSHNYVTTPAGVAPLNTWTHVATVLKGNTVSIYINGVLSVTAARVNVGAANQVFKIGVSYSGRAASFFHGYIDEFRLTKGVARYTSNFSVPTSPYPDYQDFSADQYLNNTVLLKSNSAVVPQHTVFLDNSGNNVPVTRNGDVVQSGFGPFAGAGSAYFDGTGDYLTVPNTNFQLGTGDFTIEMWFYRNSGTGAQSHLIDFRNNGGLFAIEIKSTSTINLACGDGNNNVVGSRTVNLNTWYHLAVTRASGQLKMFIDGVQDGSTYIDGGSYNAGANRPVIGAYGDGLGSYVFNGRICDLRIVKGTAVYTSNFSVPTASLTAISGTALLLNMDGASRSITSYNNSTVIDSSASKNLITRYGNVAQGTFSPFEANYDTNKYSWDFSNTGGAHFSIGSNPAFALGTGDFTMETWMYWNTDESSTAIFCGIGEPNAEQLTLWRNPDGRFSVRINQGDYLHTTIPNCAGNWHHIAVTRQGGTVRLFINGGMTGSMTNNYNMGQATFLLGSIHWAPTLRIIGKLSNFRIVKGTAVYTSGFTPPRKPLTAIAGTLVLCCQDNTFKDNSVNNWTLNPSGTTTISTASPLGVPYNAVTHGGSAYFDGSSDYLVTPITSDFIMGTSDFTIEFWCCPTFYNGNNCILSFGNATGGNGVRGIVLQISNTSQMAVLLNGQGSGGFSINATYYGSFPLNTWSHFALTRQGSNFRIFQNGSLLATINSSAAIEAPSNTGLQIGTDLSYNTHYTGYLSNLNIIKGTAKYTSNFSVPTAPETPHANTKLLLNFTNAAIADVTGKICIETSANGAILDSANKRFATSMKFNGVDGTYMRLTNSQIFNFGTADYTIEFWYYKVEQQSNYPCLFYTRWPAMGGISLMDQGGTMLMYAGGGWGIANAFNCGTLPVSSWTHVAVTRNSGITKVFLNGVQSAIHSNGGDMGWVEGDKPCIGGLYDSTRPLNGRIEDFRITKGVARYVANFTVPLKGLPVA